MAWDDPSPRTRATSRPSAQPGYGAEPISFGRLVFRIVLAGIVGVLACLLAKSGIAAWHGQASHTSSLDTVLAFAVGFAVAALAWKFVMNRPVSRGGWNGRDADAAESLVNNLVVVDMVADLADVAVDIAADL